MTSAVFDTSTLASALGGMEERAGVGSPRADPEPAPCRRGLPDGPERARDVFAGLTAAERLALGGLYDLRIPSERRLDTLLATTTPALSGALEDIRIATLAGDSEAVLLDGTRSRSTSFPTAPPRCSCTSSRPRISRTPAVIWAPWQRAAIDAQLGRFVLRPVLVDVTDPLTDHHVGGTGVFGAGALHERAAIPWADPAWIAGPPGPTT